MKKELNKVYEPAQVEDKIYKFWLDGDMFKAEPDSKKEPYCIVMPPPNITGQLHMGHALDETLQDILIRWKRMSGYSALWLPGTDHASIATEAKIVEAMREEQFHLIEVSFRPTAENFAKYFYDILKKQNIPVLTVAVYETPENCAVYEED